MYELFPSVFDMYGFTLFFKHNIGWSLQIDNGGYFSWV